MQNHERCNESESKSYCQLVRKLTWVANQSRSAICFNVCHLSSIMKASVVADLIKANAVLQKIKDSPLVIALPNLGKIYNILKYYTGTSLANLPSRSSTGAHAIFLAGKNNTVSNSLEIKNFMVCSLKYYFGRSQCHESCFRFILFYVTSIIRNSRSKYQS